MLACERPRPAGLRASASTGGTARVYLTSVALSTGASLTMRNALAGHFTFSLSTIDRRFPQADAEIRTPRQGSNYFPASR